MPEITIKLTAQTAAALAQIQAFAKGVETSFAAVKQASPGLQETSLRIRELTAAKEAAVTGSEALTGSFRKLHREGISQLTAGIPLVGEGLESLTGSMGKLGVGLGVAAGAGVALISFLRKLQDEAGKTVTEVTNLSASIQAKFLATNAAIAQITAAGEGDRLAALRHGVDAAATLAEEEKNKRVRIAQLALDTELNAFFSTEASKTQALAKFRGERAAAEVDLENTIRKTQAETAVAALQIARERAASLRELAATAAGASSERVQAELQASGAVLASVEVERKAKADAITQETATRLDAIKTLFGSEQGAADARVQVERTALDRIVKLELDTAVQRRTIIEGFVSTALTALQPFGDRFAKLGEGLKLQQQLAGARKEFEALAGIAEAFPAKMREAAEAAGAIAERLRGSGAKGPDVSALIPPGLREGIERMRELATSAFKVRDAYFQTRGAAEEYARSLGLATDAVQRLEARQTVQSLVPSLGAVGEALATTSTQVEGYTRNLATAGREVDALESEIRALDERFAALQASGGATAKVIRDVAAAAASAASATASLAPGLGTGGIANGPGFQGGTFTGSLDLSFLLEHVGERGLDPGGPLGFSASIQRIMANLKAQQRAQARVQEFLNEQLGDGFGGRGGAGVSGVATEEAAPRAPRSGGPNVTVQVLGTNIVDTDRRMEELGKNILGRILDRQRRGA